jgi:hypothetical protein
MKKIKNTKTIYWSFRGYFGHFKGSKCIGLLWSFRDYFGHIGAFGVILVILEIRSVFWL